MLQYSPHAFTIAAAATVVPQVAENQQTTVITPQQAEIQQSSAPSNSNAEEWSEEEVQTWLKENKLGSLCSQFSEYGIDGKCLEVMYNQYCEAPQEFKNDIKSEYKLAFTSIIKLVTELKKLFDKGAQGRP